MLPAVENNTRKEIVHFSQMFYFYTTWEGQETFGFLAFSGNIEMKDWANIV